MLALLRKNMEGKGESARWVAADGVCHGVTDDIGGGTHLEDIVVQYEDGNLISRVWCCEDDGRRGQDKAEEG
jgi:hypothetical protein